MYDEFAHLWPLIGPPEDYAAEASYWREALRAMLGPGRHEVLELGVGGGSNLSHLTEDFQATAVDISEKMLANSIKLNPDVITTSATCVHSVCTGNSRPYSSVTPSPT